MSDIEWCDKTWNPVTGCTKVSAGCAHCYAETVANRLWASQYPPVEVVEYEPDICSLVHEARPRAFTDVQCHQDRLDQPRRWRKPRRVFVNSMSDLFHEDVPFPFVARVMNVICATPHHTYQILTKRAERMLEFFGVVAAAEGLEAPPNMWLGVSVENQATVDERIPLLLDTPAAVRFVSAEPLLDVLDLRPYMPHPVWDGLESWTQPALDWVIVGGESGPGARPCDVGWIHALVHQCREAGVPAFVKQLGAAPEVTASVLYLQAWPEGVRFERADPDGCAHAYTVRCRDRKGADPAEWPADLRVREWPGVAAETPGVTSA